MTKHCCQVCVLSDVLPLRWPTVCMVSGNLNTKWFDINTPTGQHGSWPVDGLPFPDTGCPVPDVSIYYMSNINELPDGILFHWFCKCTPPWMFLPLDIPSEYRPEHVTFGLLCVIFKFPSRIFCRRVPGFGLWMACPFRTLVVLYRMFPFIICLILMNYLMEFYFIGFVNAHLPGCFCPWTFRLNIGLNTSPSDSFVSYLNSHLGYSAGEFQALQLIVLAVFGAVD